LGFWSNLSNGIAQTANILTIGAEGFGNLTVNIKEATARFNIEQIIETLENRRRKAGNAWFSTAYSSDHKQLLSLYRTFLSDYGEASTEKLSAAFDKLQFDEKIHEVKKQVNNITNFTEFISTTEFDRPVDAINERKILIKMLLKLTEEATNNQHYLLSIDAPTRINDLNVEIADLEIKRRTKEELICKKTGEKSIKCRKDQKLDGMTETFYDNDKKRLQVSFKQGFPMGRVRYWRLNDALLMDAELNQQKGHIRFKCYSESSHEVLTGTISNGQVNMIVRVLDFKPIQIRINQIRDTSKLILFLKVVTKLRVLKIIWVARNEGITKIALLELRDIGKLFELATQEIGVIKKDG
jgi:hypothetical protein